MRRPLLAGPHAISHWWVMELRKVPGPHVMGGGAGGGEGGGGGERGGGGGKRGGEGGGGRRGGEGGGGGGECRSRSTTVSLSARDAAT
jgi:hypothetical protein